MSSAELTKQSHDTAHATTAVLARARFRLLRFRSPLLTECLFLRVLRCFSSPGALYLAYVFNQKCLNITSSGLPHSEIAGSAFASNSPTLIAGSRVLPRLVVPRHPPWTLSSLSIIYNHTLHSLKRLLVELDPNLLVVSCPHLAINGKNLYVDIRLSMCWWR